MSTRTDYGEVAGRVDYSKLEKKLDQLRDQEPPKKRKRAADLLAPVRDKLRELHGKGWTYAQLAAELKSGGIPVAVGTLRDYLTGREHRRKKAAGRRGSKHGQTTG